MPRVWWITGAPGDGSPVQDRRLLDVVLKALPVLECRQCGEIEMEDQTMRRVDQVLAGVDTSSELEVIRFAA
jgi:hypothetical protein